MKAYLPKHSAVKELDAACEELGARRTESRLRMPLHLLMYILHGKVDAEIQGVENLINAAGAAKETNGGFVVATTHESGLDVPTAAYLASRVGSVVINAASTNLDFIKKEAGGFNPEAIQYILAGRDNFYPVPYSWQTRGAKLPKPFSEEDYDGLASRVRGGDIAVVSAFSDHESVKHRKVGSAAVHTALAAGALIVPVRVSSDKSGAFSGGVSLAVLEDHSLFVDIGKPIITPETLSIEYAGADGERKTRIRQLIRAEIGSGLYPTYRHPSKKQE